MNADTIQAIRAQMEAEVGAARPPLLNEAQAQPEAARQLRALPLPEDGQAVAHNLARLIDHTALKPDTTRDQIAALCDEALTHQFASVCINPFWVPLAAERLAGSDVLVCTVIGFPLGATTTATKRAETVEVCQQGAREVDMVLNIGALKSGLWRVVYDDIRTVADAAHEHDALLKVIIETVLLSGQEKVQASSLVALAGADFVKSSTGFAAGGATRPDVALMRATVGDRIGVKAAGGVRTVEDAIAFVRAGATRLGASAGVEIVEQAKGGSWNASVSSSSY